VTLLEPRTLHQPEKLQNVSKNDYVFTLPISYVNEIPERLTGHLSIECKPFTGGCHEKCAVPQTLFRISSVHAVFSPHL
jgi:hypothetical protein